jgi:hypothetical protein
MAITIIVLFSCNNEKQFNISSFGTLKKQICFSSNDSLFLDSAKVIWNEYSKGKKSIISIGPTEYFYIGVIIFDSVNYKKLKEKFLKYGNFTKPEFYNIDNIEMNWLPEKIKEKIIFKDEKMEVNCRYTFKSQLLFKSNMVGGFVSFLDDDMVFFYGGF